MNLFWAFISDSHGMPLSNSVKVNKKSIQLGWRGFFSWFYFLPELYLWFKLWKYHYSNKQTVKCTWFGFGAWATTIVCLMIVFGYPRFGCSWLSNRVTLTLVPLNSNIQSQCYFTVYMFHISIEYLLNTRTQWIIMVLKHIYRVNTINSCKAKYYFLVPPGSSSK